MLVPAMAFVWCVLSAQAAEAQNAAHAAVAPAHVAVDSRPKALAHPRDAEAAVEPAAAPGEQRVPIRNAIPAGVIAFAKTLVSLPMGSERVAEIAGQRYVFVLERHYHPPGFVGAPNGWHKGVTAYELH